MYETGMSNSIVAMVPRALPFNHTDSPCCKCKDIVEDITCINIGRRYYSSAEIVTKTKGLHCADQRLRKNRAVARYDLDYGMP